MRSPLGWAAKGRGRAQARGTEERLSLGEGEARSRRVRAVKHELETDTATRRTAALCAETDFDFVGVTFATKTDDENARPFVAGLSGLGSGIFVISAILFVCCLFRGSCRPVPRTVPSGYG